MEHLLVVDELQSNGHLDSPAHHIVRSIIQLLLTLMEHWAEGEIHNVPTNHSLSLIIYLSPGSRGQTQVPETATVKDNKFHKTIIIHSRLVCWCSHSVCLGVPEMGAVEIDYVGVFVEH